MLTIPSRSDPQAYIRRSSVGSRTEAWEVPKHALRLDSEHHEALQRFPDALMRHCYRPSASVKSAFAREVYQM